MCVYVCVGVGMGGWFNHLDQRKITLESNEIIQIMISKNKIKPVHSSLFGATQSNRHQTPAKLG
jgi:hypothetical protein